MFQYGGGSPEIMTSTTKTKKLGAVSDKQTLSIRSGYTFPQKYKQPNRFITVAPIYLGFGFGQKWGDSGLVMIVMVLEKKMLIQLMLLGVIMVVP